MRLARFYKLDSIQGNARKLYLLAGLVMCGVLVYLLGYVAALNADIRQANAQADLERQCAHALEAWVHRQVAPGDTPQAEALDTVKDKACRTKLVL